MKYYLAFGLSLMMFGCITGGELFERGVLAHYGAPVDGWKNTSGKNITNPNSPTKKSLDNGKKLYEKHCNRCHGPEGLGDGYYADQLKNRPANLAKTVKSKSDSYLYLQISQGRLNMPIWKNRLEKTERWDIVNYIKTLK
jgi:mono/diheme cytochrome c family protein